jgi:drug/metabolite transporter (DMT)-like permease
MAEPIQIQGSSYMGKIRNPLAVVGLAIITLGIYGIFWYYYANKELAEIGKARGTDECGDSPGTSVLAITLGALVIVPALVSAYRFTKRLQAAERLTGAPEGMEPGLLFLLYIFLAPIAAYIAQSNLNKVLQAQASGTPAAAPPPAAPEAAEEQPAPEQAAPATPEPPAQHEPPQQP